MLVGQLRYVFKESLVGYDGFKLFESLGHCYQQEENVDVLLAIISPCLTQHSTTQCVVLCCVVSCCVVSCCAVLCCVVLCCAVLCCVVLCCVVLCCVVLCCVVLCCVVLCCVVLCSVHPKNLMNTSVTNWCVTVV